jgi:hypothetical protein
MSYERECNSASFPLVIYALGYPDGKMLLSRLYVSARDAPGESAARLSQLYLAWGEGVTLAG